MQMTSNINPKIAYSINLDEKLYKKLNTTAHRLGVHKSLIVHVALERLFNAKDLKIKLD